MKKLIPFLLSVLLLTSCAAKTDTGSEKKSQTVEQKTASAAESMTTEEKVGQLFMARCDSTNMEPILKKQPGGIVMFAVDFEDLTEKEVRKKIESYKDACGIEPIIAVDEEGGTVVRVSSNPNLSPAKYEGPQYYYGLGGIEAVVGNTVEKSQLLKKLGITMNLAPVADVSTDPSDFIYDRSLGQNAEITAEYTSAVTEAAKNEGLMSCLKHFPGYGNNVDTHTGIAIDNRSLDSFRSSDFLPFKSGIAAGASAVLVSHNIITAADPDEPASISPQIHSILRDELGFDGIIMTDDMSMQAMAEYETPYTRAVLAGNDMIIVSDFDAAYAEVMAAVQDGTISEELLNNAVNRLIKVKTEYGLSVDF
ncbi:MAG: glycoside hydrolase family 3 N-terminal domain-containing protein [Candidatus Ornithomonoglobus sp.]